MHEAETLDWVISAWSEVPGVGEECVKLRPWTKRGVCGVEALN